MSFQPILPQKLLEKQSQKQWKQNKKQAWILSDELLLQQQHWQYPSEYAYDHQAAYYEYFNTTAYDSYDKMYDLSVQLDMFAEDISIEIAKSSASWKQIKEQIELSIQNLYGASLKITIFEYGSMA